MFTNFLKMKIFIVLTLLFNYCNSFIDPISIGIGSAIIGFSGYYSGTIKDHTYCKLYECCNDHYIPGKLNILERDLKQNLFGQHILINMLLPALRGQFQSKTRSKKPLVISFHGTPGTGKTYVSDYIASSIYKKGIESKFVHKFLGRADFPYENNKNMYQNTISTKIRESIKECPKSLFIFDEVEKMPSGIFDSITSLLDHNNYVNGVDYSKSTFIFISNSGGVEIAEQLGKLMSFGAQRDQTSLDDFERILEMAAYNLNGGLKDANIIESHLIDHYIPFLPLEKHHIRKCIVAEYDRFGVRAKNDAIEDLLTNFITYDPTYGIFSKMGCKRLSKKIEVNVMRIMYGN